MKSAIASPSPSPAIKNFIATLQELSGLDISYAGLRDFSRSKKFSLDKSALAGRCGFCRLVSFQGPGLRRCLGNDASMMARAAESQGPVIRRCHAGLVELVIPLMAGAEALGFIFAGQVHDGPAEAGAFQGRLGAAFKAAPRVEKEALRLGARRLHLMAGLFTSSLRMLREYQRARLTQGRLRTQLLLGLVEGSLKPKGGFSELFFQVFGFKGAVQGLVAVKLAGFSPAQEPLHEIEEIRASLEQKAKGAVQGVEAAAAYGGSGLFFVLASGRQRALLGADLDALTRFSGELAAKHWQGPVFAASGGLEAVSSRLYRAVDRALQALESREFPWGRQPFAADEREDSLPSLISKLEEAVRFGGRGRVESLLVQCLQAALESGGTDRGKRAHLLETLKVLGAGKGLDQNARIYDCVEMVIQAKAADEALLARLKPGLDWVLAFMGAPGAGLGRPLLKLAGEYLNAHLGEKISVSRAAAALGMSPSAFSRGFRKAGGVSFSRFMAGRRVEEACKWLAQSDLAIPKIAARCGFRDLHYFSLVFKKLKGVPPARFRRNERARAGKAASL